MLGVDTAFHVTGQDRIAPQARSATALCHRLIQLYHAKLHLAQAVH